MNAMDVLSRCRGAEERIRRTKTQIRQRRQAAAAIPSPMGREGPPDAADGDRTARWAAEIDRLERQLRHQVERQIAETAAACLLLDRLGENESAVLYGYYVSGETVAALSRRLKYSESYIRRLKARGEGALRRLGEDEVRAALPNWYVKEESDG